jgi:hypothetical protein
LNRVLPVLGGVVGAAALMALSAGPGAAATTAPVSGTATGLYVDASVLGAVHLGPLSVSSASYPQGPAKDSLLAVNVPDLLKADVLYTSAKVKNDGKLHSHADLVNVDLNLAKILPSLPNIFASVLDADVWANGASAGPDAPATDQPGVKGQSDVLFVKIGTQTIKLTANKPVNLNQVTGLLSALTNGTVTITFDEQVWNADHTALTVNALDIAIGGGLLDQLGLAALDHNNTFVHIIVSQATAKIGAVDTGVGGGVPVGTGGGATTTPAPTTTAPATTTSAAAGAGSGRGTGTGTQNLAYTGVSAVVPMTIGGVVLVVLGGGALYWTTRRRKATAGTGSDN